MAPKTKKMVTIEQLAVGAIDVDQHNQARIERNLFAINGRSWEALRFCKNRDGRHNRVHLVIEQEAFVDLFRTHFKTLRKTIMKQAI